ELLEQPAPLVDTAHALHEEALRARVDRLLVDADLAELEVELALVPDEEAIDRGLAAELAELGVLERAVLEVDGAAPSARGEVEHAALAADVDRLEQIDHAHVGEGPAETGLGPHGLALEGFALVALELELDPREDLFDVDGLGEVIGDAELEAADLALHRGVAREEDQRDVLELFVFAELLDEGEAIEVGKDRVGQDEIGPGERDHLQRARRVLTGRHAETGLAQADLENAETALISVDEEEVLLRHEKRSARYVSVENATPACQASRNPRFCSEHSEM